MLFSHQSLEAIRAGDVDLAFRRWKRPSVRTGRTLRTALGVLAIDSVEIVTEDEITEDDAKRAGAASRAALLAELNRRGSAEPLHRIELRYDGSDPRIALRQRSELSARELAEAAERLRALDSRRERPWTREVLELLRRKPGVAAADLATTLGRETQALKRDIRKLKELGLTESLNPGYRLSPRGETVLEKLPRGPE